METYRVYYCRVINYYKNNIQIVKSLEISMNLPNVEDMPFEHGHWVKPNEIPMVLSYNKNDVYATNVFLDVTLGNTEHPLYKGKNKIELRQKVGLKYGLRSLNWNDIKLGTELILKLYCEKFNKDPKVIRKLRTPRPIIRLKECLPKWTKFNRKEFDKLVNYFSNSIIYNGVTKDVLKTSVIFHGFKFDYGTGGCHGCIKPGIYKSDDKWIILDLDIDLINWVN